MIDVKALDFWEPIRNHVEDNDSLLILATPFRTDINVFFSDYEIRMEEDITRKALEEKRDHKVNSTDRVWIGIVPFSILYVTPKDGTFKEVKDFKDGLETVNTVLKRSNKNDFISFLFSLGGIIELRLRDNWIFKGVLNSDIEIKVKENDNKEISDSKMERIGLQCYQWGIGGRNSSGLDFSD